LLHTANRGYVTRNAYKQGGKNKKKEHNIAAYWNWNLKHSKLESNFSFKISATLD
jgi:hypothetical protein